MSVKDASTARTTPVDVSKGWLSVSKKIRYFYTVGLKKGRKLYRD